MMAVENSSLTLLANPQAADHQTKIMIERHKNYQYISEMHDLLFGGALKIRSKLDKTPTCFVLRYIHNSVSKYMKEISQSLLNT